MSAARPPARLRGATSRIQFARALRALLRRKLRSDLRLEVGERGPRAAPLLAAARTPRRQKIRARKTDARVDCTHLPPTTYHLAPSERTPRTSIPLPERSSAA